jgi:ParB family chromosome partitioning protein
MKIPVDCIYPNPDQPRAKIDPADLEPLAASIRDHGLINAIAVEDVGNGQYFLIDGERRWRASRIVGLLEIEATVHPPMNGKGSTERLVLAMAANLQRQDMNPVEEAKAYRKLLDLGHRIDQVAQLVGVSTATIRLRLSLLQLEEPIQDLFAQRKLALGPTIVQAIRNIPEDKRLKTIVSLAQRGSSEKTIAAVSARLASAARHPDNPIDDADAPAMGLARKSTGKKEPGKGWDILEQIGKAPKWLVVIAAAQATCKSCSLYELASTSTCRDCPAVQMIKQLMETA